MPAFWAGKERLYGHVVDLSSKIIGVVLGNRLLYGNHLVLKNHVV